MRQKPPFPSVEQASPDDRAIEDLLTSDAWTAPPKFAWQLRNRHKVIVNVANWPE
jgi:hypothetical protein